MSVVGEFPGVNAMRRRAIRGPINELDKSTIVSLYPKEIFQRNPTIQPGEFLIPAGTVDKPGILVVGPSSWWRDVDEDQPLLEIPVSSVQIAESVVRDYCNSVLGVNGSDATMGVFYVAGEHTREEIKKNFAGPLAKAVATQKKWYENLVKMGDSLWARSNGNPLAIDENMRTAAKQLGQTNKDWLKDFQAVDMVRCYACGSLKHPDYAVCMTCRAIDPKHAKAADIRFHQAIEGKG